MLCADAEVSLLGTLLALMFALAPAFAADGPVVASVAEDAGTAYQVDQGDVLDIQVYDEPRFNGNTTVSEGGVIDVPLYGQVRVEGLTALEIARKLEAELSVKHLVDPHVTVRVAVYGSKQIQVQGAVNKPGLYYLNGPTTVLQLISKAEGTRPNVNQVQVTRADGQIVLLALDSLREGNDDFLLQKGDSIFVDEGQSVYVGGQVAHPGEVAYKEGMTITEAITLAGSWSPTALKSTVYILRDGQRMRVNVRRILKAKDADILLLPGDQVQVPESAV